jgi:Protein of unknown function (DUF1826)
MLDQDQIVEKSAFDRGQTHAPSHVIARADRTVLAHIPRSGINLAVWQRPAPDPIVTWLRAASLSDLLFTFREIDFEGPAACIGALLAAKIRSHASYEHAAKMALVSDVADLANVTAKLAHVTSVRVRLEWVMDQPCSYFHIDKVPLRLVCTYFGPGTEWLSDETAKRLTAPDEIPAQIEINRLAAGAVAVMRGAPYGPAIGTGLTHRSPPVHSPSDGRLFLAVDPVSAGNAWR